MMIWDEPQIQPLNNLVLEPGVYHTAILFDDISISLPSDILLCDIALGSLSVSAAVRSYRMKCASGIHHPMTVRKVTKGG